MPDSLKAGKSSFDLSDLIKAAEAQKNGTGERPVDKWNPAYCGEMDMIIRKDGTWFHEGSPIGRRKLVELFASILRKDGDGETYLVTPVEKIKIAVERTHFIGTRIDVEGEGPDQRVFVTTDVGDVVEIGPDRPFRIVLEDGHPLPIMTVRGRLEAVLSRPAYYELAEHAVEAEVNGAIVAGFYSGGAFFPLDIAA